VADDDDRSPGLQRPVEHADQCGDSPPAWNGVGAIPTQPAGAGGDVLLFYGDDDAATMRFTGTLASLAEWISWGSLFRIPSRTSCKKISLVIADKIWKLRRPGTTHHHPATLQRDDRIRRPRKEAFCSSADGAIVFYNPARSSTTRFTEARQGYERSCYGPFPSGPGDQP